MRRDPGRSRSPSIGRCRARQPRRTAGTRPLRLRGLPASGAVFRTCAVSDAVAPAFTLPKLSEPGSSGHGRVGPARDGGGLHDVPGLIDDAGAPPAGARPGVDREGHRLAGCERGLVYLRGDVRPCFLLQNVGAKPLRAASTIWVRQSEICRRKRIDAISQHSPPATRPPRERGSLFASARAQPCPRGPCTRPCDEC